MFEAENPTYLERLSERKRPASHIWISEPEWFRYLGFDQDTGCSVSLGLWAESWKNMAKSLKGWPFGVQLTHDNAFCSPGMRIEQHIIDSCIWYQMSPSWRAVHSAYCTGCSLKSETNKKLRRLLSVTGISVQL
jgi:hypothetical protein